MPIITRKIELKPDIDGLSNEESKNKCYELLRELDNTIYKAANLLVGQMFGMEEFVTMMRLQNDEYVTICKQMKLKKTTEDQRKQLKVRLDEIDAQINVQRQEMAPKGMRTFAGRAVKRSEYANSVPGEILECLKEVVFTLYSDVTKERRKGERTLSTYKKGMPIPFRFWGAQRLVQSEDKFYLQWYNGTRFLLDFGKDRSNNKLIVQRCLGIAEDEISYKTMSSLQLKKNKIFLLLNVEIPKTKFSPIEGKVMGVDLGIVWPAYVAVNNGPEHEHIGDGKNIQNMRNMFWRRFRELQRCQLTQEGHGRKHRTKALEHLHEKERNWIKTENHRISHRIVELAKRWQVETIQMENLKGFGKDKNGNVDDQHKRVLERWSYFELQKDVEYKADIAGIKVRYVNPAYTSLRCSKCGKVGVRPERELFFCTNVECDCYNRPIKADENAARNIAKSNDIIKNKDKDNVEN